MKQTFGSLKDVRPLLALFIIFGAFSFLFTIIWKTIPTTNQNLVALAEGYVLGMVSMVAGYYFGPRKDMATEHALNASKRVSKKQAVAGEGIS